MIPLLHVIGLIVSFLGALLLFLDSLRINDRLPGTGVTLAADEPYKHPLWKFVASTGFALVALGFALQLPAACNAHFDQEPADVHETLDYGP